ncbi:hypothetical protein BG015_011423 [Linnemannia schmuckeri]|uniref:Uncharacterized protein n=1 Tax=Linnemannia schmuckeri TaxID=64567 RepID=A0A9P5RUQ5_9FUNG|nr:hypothetical protein BG015_011423 [Linnemannia schmuckeri]
MPFWLWKFALSKTVRYRPHIRFFEAVPLKGTVSPLPSPSELKARAAFEERKPVVTAAATL